MHPSLEKFIEEFEEQATRSGQYRRTLGKYERLFLDQVWGPAFHYNFSGLKPEYPLKDFKGGDRFVDFVYTRGGVRLLIEIDGFTTHARDISPGDFDDHLMRQNDLILSGWLVLRFSSHQVEKRSVICQRQIVQAIGHWWTLTHNTFNDSQTEIWTLRKRLLIQLALRQDGIIRTQDVAREFSLPHRTAHSWISRCSSDDDTTFIPIKPNHRIVGYQLTGYLIDNYN